MSKSDFDRGYRAGVLAATAAARALVDTLGSFSVPPEAWKDKAPHLNRDDTRPWCGCDGSGYYNDPVVGAALCECKR